MARFYFGPKHNGPSHFVVEAPTLTRAITMFRTSALYPHAYSTAPIWDSDAESGAHDAGASRLYRTARASAPGAVIPVWSAQWDELAQIPVEDPNYAGSPPDLTRVLVDAEGFVAGPGSGPGSALTLAGSNTGLATAPRSELEERDRALRKLMAELEAKKYELYKAAEQLRGELARRQEQVWLIELFLGSKEEVFCLRVGEPAPVGTKITVHQSTLCMDEEIAVLDMDESPDQIGQFDAMTIERFDKALIERPALLKTVLPEPKGIRALRIRRNTKHREAKDLAGSARNAELAQADLCTYLLIRNGENLYRLWIDVVLWPRLIPRVEEINGECRNRSAARDEANTRKHYAAGMVAINGILQRSTLLHPLPKADLSVFDSADVAAHFDVAHDDEGKNLLGDGRAFEHVTWNGYAKWLRERIEPGMRVLWVPGDQYGGKDDALWDRTGIRTVQSWPQAADAFGWRARAKRDPLEFYIVEEIAERDRVRYGPDFTFKYLPKDTIYRGNRDFDGGERKRRVAFRSYREELLPIDLVSWRVLDHLLRDRGQREHYEHMFRRVLAYRAFAKAETERERPFVDLVLGKVLGTEGLSDELERARCERLIRWWKLKTKENRSLGSDEAKALRMIEAAFAKGQDFDDDPEKGLSEARMAGA